MTVKEKIQDLHKLNPYHGIMITHNGSILALAGSEYLLTVADYRGWGNKEVKSVNLKRLDAWVIEI